MSAQTGNLDFTDIREMATNLIYTVSISPENSAFPIACLSPLPISIDRNIDLLLGWNGAVVGRVDFNRFTAFPS